MKDTEFVVNAFRKGMTENEMNDLAFLFKSQYDEGFAHHEGFDAGDLAIVVMKRERDEAQAQLSDTNPPDLLCAAQTLNTALQQANQTIEYLRNEIDALKKMNAGQSVNINAVSGENLFESYNDLRRRLKEVEQQIANEGNAGLRVHVASERLKTALEGLNAKPEMMTVEDAKTLANVAYNRGRSIGELYCQLDFEDWWTEFRKENGFTSEPKADAITDDQVKFNTIMGVLKNIARTTMGWSNFEGEAPNIALYGSFWKAIHIRFGYENEGRKVSDGNRREYLESIANNIIQYRKDNPTEEPKPKADPITAPKAIPTRAEVAQTIKDLAVKHFGWHVLGWQNPFFLEHRSQRLAFREELREVLDNELNSVRLLAQFKGTRFQWVQQLENQIMAALEAQP